MKQQVIITQLADRHRDNARAFAESHEVITEAGPLRDVLTRVAAVLAHLPVSRYTVVVGEPYEETSQ